MRGSVSTKLQVCYSCLMCIAHNSCGKYTPSNLTGLLVYLKTLDAFLNNTFFNVYLYTCTYHRERISGSISWLFCRLKWTRASSRLVRSSSRSHTYWTNTTSTHHHWLPPVTAATTTHTSHVHNLTKGAFTWSLLWCASDAHPKWIELNAHRSCSHGITSKQIQSEYW